MNDIEKLIQDIKRFGIEFDHHESDLYIFASTDNINKLQLDFTKYGVFTDQISNAPMYDIPFAYDDSMKKNALEIQRKKDGSISYAHYSPDMIIEHYSGIYEITGTDNDGHTISVRNTPNVMEVNIDGHQTDIPNNNIPRNKNRSVELGQIIEGVKQTLENTSSIKM